MPGRRRPRPRRRSLGLLLLLLLLFLLLPLSGFLAGVLPGGGWRESRPSAGAARAAGTLLVCVVEAESGAPVEGAVVEVEGLGSGASSARSDARGEARLDGLGGEAVRVEASAGGSAGARWVDPRADASVVLAVEPAPRRAGRTVGPGGAPARALARLLDAAGEVLAEARTDAEGRYELPDDPRAASVCASAEGLAPGAAREGDVALAAGVEVAGRIAGAGAGTLRVFSSCRAPGRDEPLPVVADWPVGADGSFRGALPAGARAYALADGLPVRLRAGELSLPSRVEAHGSVVGPGGVPAAGASLLFRPLLGEDFPVPLPGLRVVAGRDGTFRAKGFCATDYAVEARAAGCAATLFPRVAPADGPLEIRLEAGFRLSGRVVDAAGLPLCGAELVAMGVPDDAGRFLPATARSGRDGLFVLEGLGGTSARLRVAAPGFHPTTLEALSASANLRVPLQRR